MKLRIAAATAVLLGSLSAPVLAQDLMNMELRPYVGFDLQRTGMSYNDSYNDGGTTVDIDDYLDGGLYGGNIHVGARTGEHLGFEVGYFHNREAEEDLGAGVETTIQTNGVTLDGIAYLPIDEAKKLDLIATAGVMYTNAEVEITLPTLGTFSEDESELGFRVGGGAQYNITEKASVRGLMRYESADFEDIAEHAWTYAVGLNYLF